MQKVRQWSVWLSSNPARQERPARSARLTVYGSSSPPGFVPDPESLLAHAAQCDHCGALLRDAVEDLTGECTPQEEAQIAGLASATPKWQKDLSAEPGQLAREGARRQTLARVDRDSGCSTPLRPWFSSSSRPGLCFIDHQPTPPNYCSPTLTLSTAPWNYASQERNMRRYVWNAGRDYRILTSPDSLLRAESIIAEHLRKNPNDVEFLDAKARADLIDGNFDSAIKTLQRAMETQPLSPVLMTDLATAYFARAEATGQAIDYGRAIDNLGKVLAASPDDSLALFNRAICRRKDVPLRRCRCRLGAFSQGGAGPCMARGRPAMA